MVKSTSSGVDRSRRRDPGDTPSRTSRHKVSVRPRRPRTDRSPVDKGHKGSLPQANSSPIQESYRTEQPMTLLDLIIDRSGRSRTAAKRLIALGRISVDDRPTTLATLTVEPGSTIAVHRYAPVAPFTHPRIAIAWEDESYVVVYKQTGIATVNTAHKDPRETVLNILSRHYKKSDPRAKLFMLSRLDKSSAGYVLFAKSLEAKERLSRNWADAVHHQRFALVVEGTLPGETFLLSATSEPSEKERRGNRKGSDKDPITVTAEVQLVESSAAGGLHLVEADVRGARIFSMRKIFGDNKLRIFGDIRYHSHYYAKDRIALEQTELEITWSHTGETIRLSHPLPTTFRQLLRRDSGDITEGEEE